MKETRKNLFPQKNGRYSLQDYYDALKYRNLDKRMEKLALGIVHVIDNNRKMKKSASQEGMLKSILGEYLDVTPTWTEDNKLQLYVKSINIPNDLKPAFLPEKDCKSYPVTKADREK